MALCSLQVLDLYHIKIRGQALIGDLKDLILDSSLSESSLRVKDLLILHTHSLLSLKALKDSLP